MMTRYRGFRRYDHRLGGLLSALLIASAVSLAACSKKEDTPPQPKAPVTTLALTGIDPGTLIVGNRFGVAPTGPDGVEVTLTASKPGAITYYDDTCTATYTVYDPAAKPQVTTSLTVCYYSEAEGKVETEKQADIIFDATAPTPTLTDQFGGDLAAATASYTDYPTLTPGFNTTLIAPDYYSGEGGKIYYTTDTSSPVLPPNPTPSPAIDIVDGIGQGSFFFSHPDRLVRMVVVDDVGNVGLEVAIRVPLDIVGTVPSAGNFKAATNVKLDPTAAYFVDGLSAANLLLCQYTDAAGYECFDNTLTTPAASPEVHATTGDYAYTLGTSPPTSSESIALAGSAGVTTVYDAKFLYDSWTPDGVTDNDHQAIFVVDLDLPTALEYPNPLLATDGTLATSATVFDSGFYTVLESGITNYGLQRDPLDQCVTDVVCIQPISPTVSVTPATATRPTDNKAVAFTVTATDAAGNVLTRTDRMPIGRSILQGSATAAYANLGQAVASGNFNADGSAVPGAPERAPDYAVSEPSRGAGAVYLFYDDLRSQVAIPSASFATIDVSAGSTLGLTVAIGDAAPIALTLDLLGARDYVFPSSPAALTPALLAAAFNRAVLDLAKLGTDLQIYMAPTDSDNDSVVDNVTVFSRSGQIDTCITITDDALGLQGLLGLTPTAPQCVYDAKIVGQTAGDLFGHALAVADFNGDGFADLAVGAPNAGGTGKVYLFYSDGTAAPTFPATAPDTNADSVISGGAAGDDFGWVIAAGNLTYGRDPALDLSRDLLIGAPGFTVGAYADAGKVYLFQAPFTAAMTTAGSTHSVENPRTLPTTYIANERFGHSLLVAQLNNAGADELIIGAPGSNDLDVSAGGGANAGSAYFGIVNSSQMINLPLGSIDGKTADSKFGWSLANVGGMYADQCTAAGRCVAIGAPHGVDAISPKANQGAVYIANTTNFAFESGIVSLYGSAAGDELGVAIASADINGDGYSDLVVGQRSWDNLTFKDFFGGIGIVKGAAIAPTTAVLTKQYTGIEVNLSSGADVPSRFGSTLLLTDSDPDDLVAVDRLIIGGPAGTPTFGSSPTGRLHVFKWAAFASGL